MAGCGGKCGSGSCGGGGGHHGGHCASGAHKDPGDYKPGEEIPRLPYESLYQRCKCGVVALSPEVWATIKDSSGVCRIVTSGGWHSPEECPAPANLPFEIREIARGLGDPLPGEEKIG